MAESPAGELRHSDAERRDERRERQGDLVTDTTGRMLVGGRLAESVEGEGLPGGDHREGEVADLGALHTVEEDRHGHGRHLLVGDVATGVRVDEPGDLLSRQHALVPLGADEVDDVEWFYGHDGSNR